MSFKIDQLQQVPDWTCNGFLHGYNLLSEELFSALENFDYDLLPQVAVPFGQLRRNCLSCNPYHNEGNSLVLYELMKPTMDYLSDQDVLCTLIERSFENPGVWPLERFWAGGLNAIRRLRTKGMICHLNEDYEGFNLSPHMDHHECIAFLQVFIDPEGYNVGTKFHDPHNLSDTRQVPFVKNSGYFVTNTYRAMHSVLNDQPIKRRSLIIGWIM